MALASPQIERYQMIKNQNVNRVFNDLDNFKVFCVEYGFVFNEADLYKRNTHAYSQFERVRRGEKIPNNWDTDARLYDEKSNTNIN
jgi:hypothetical protein